MTVAMMLLIWISIVLRAQGNSGVSSLKAV